MNCWLLRLENWTWQKFKAQFEGFLYSNKFSLPYPHRFVFAPFSVSIIFVSVFVSGVSDSDFNSEKNMETKTIKVVSVRFRTVFTPRYGSPDTTAVDRVRINPKKYTYISRWSPAETFGPNKNWLINTPVGVSFFARKYPSRCWFKYRVDWTNSPIILSYFRKKMPYRGGALMFDT